MAAPDQHAKNLADLYQMPEIEWEAVRGILAGQLSQVPGSGGPNHHTYWLTTVDGDGRPHITAVGVMVADDRFYFSGSPRSRKIRNIERDDRCAFGVAGPGFDVTLEGRASRVTDTEKLERIAKLFSDWGPEVADGGFTHDYSAPSAGPPPWFVYEFVPESAVAVLTREPGGATRWTFDSD
jgi:hypothetical protein